LAPISVNGPHDDVLKQSCQAFRLPKLQWVAGESIVNLWMHITAVHNVFFFFSFLLILALFFPENSYDMIMVLKHLFFVS
jgi:hypothetical protein